MKLKTSLLILTVGLVLVSCNQGLNQGTDEPQEPNVVNEAMSSSDEIEFDWEIAPIPTPKVENKQDFIFSVIQQTLPLLDYGYYADAVALASHIEDYFFDESTGGFFIKFQIEAYFNSICWTGALDHQPEEVIEICNTLVEAAPEVGASRDSRGIARVLLGEEYYEGALEDFRFFVDWHDSLSDDERELYELNDEIVARRIGWIESLEAGINPIDTAELQRLNDVEGQNFKESMNFWNEEVYYWVAFDSLLYFEHYFDVFSVISKLEMFEDSDVSENWHAVCIHGSLRGVLDEVMIACEKAIETSSEIGKYHDGRGIARALSGDYSGAIEDLNVAKEYLISQLDSPGIREYVNISYYQISVPDYDRWIEGLMEEELPFTQGDIDNLNYPFVNVNDPRDPPVVEVEEN